MGRGDLPTFREAETKDTLVRTRLKFFQRKGEGRMKQLSFKPDGACLLDHQKEKLMESNKKPGRSLESHPPKGRKGKGKQRKVTPLQREGWEKT